MGVKAVFLDRDGVIIEDKGYTHLVEDLVFMPNAIKGLQLLKNCGYDLFVVTNQGGIGLGKYTEDQFLKFTWAMLRELQESGIDIKRVYYCPHRPDATVEEYRLDCVCRKPKNGMLIQAIKDFGIDIDKSWLIGDKDSDIVAGKLTGLKTILILTGEGCKFVGRSDMTPDYICEDLLQAARVISCYDNIK